MDQFQNFRVNGEYFSFVQMDKWTEKSKYLMALCQDNGLIINKFYWRSIFDYETIELFEPKIVDAYYMHIDISGDPSTVEYVLDEYSKVAKMLESITVVEPLTEDEIKEIATKALQNMVIFQ